MIFNVGCRLTNTDDEGMCRAIKLLHECTKELATKRLPLDRKAFCDVRTPVSFA